MRVHALERRSEARAPFLIRFIRNPQTTDAAVTVSRCRRHVCYYSTSRRRTGLSRVINVEHPGRWAPRAIIKLDGSSPRAGEIKFFLSSSLSKKCHVIEENYIFHSFHYANEIQ